MRTGLLEARVYMRRGSATLAAMTREELLQRIWIDPLRCFGKPCIRGHRIWVSLILDLLAGGSKVAEFWRTIPAWRKRIFKRASLLARRFTPMHECAINAV